MFNIFPKRAFAAGDMDAFQGLLEQHLGNTSKAYRKKVRLKTWIWAAVFVIVTVLPVIKIWGRRGPCRTAGPSPRSG
jgi:hypothetical protein